jgi:hypothetical protein
MALLRISAVGRNAMVDAIRALLDAGAGAATVKFYTGTQPATPETALSGQTLLATLTMTDPAAPGASGGTLTFSAITEDSAADASGTATWARVEDSNSVAIFDADVTATGGGGIIQINTVTIAAGGPVRITSATLNIPVTTG